MRYRMVIGLAAAAAIVVGCTSNPVSDNTDNNVSEKFAVSRSLSAVRDVIAETDTRLTTQAASNNDFAMKMYSELTKSDTGNLFFSPFSIVSALGMADAGADGETDEQIRAALQVQLSGDDFHAALNGLDQSLESYAESVENLELSNVNSIWAQNGQGFALKIGYLDKLARNYDAGVNLLNFMEEPEPSRIIINDWVSEQTKNRIEDLLPEGSINERTRVVLTNAVYFLADWQLKFDASETADESFTRKDGTKVTVPMMKLHVINGATYDKLELLYGRVDSTKILELPYCGSRLVMDFLLPDSGAFDYFEDNLSKQTVDALVNSLDSVKLPSVQIPRFEFSTASISLKNAFVALGMEAPFSMDADFSAMSEENLSIADIFHKAYIKVDENGTEAAAATAVSFEVTAVMPMTFIADRPFIYLIRDIETNMILFMGRVLDPTVTM